MASALYDLARQAFAAGDLDWDANNIKTVLVDTGAYTVNLGTHQFLSDIPGGARIATSGNLTNKTNVGGVLDADDVTFTLVSGATVEALVIYQDSGVAGTSRLIAYIDTATGLPVSPSGGDITIVWDNGANKILKI
jgi:hypothetical protein